MKKKFLLCNIVFILLFLLQGCSWFEDDKTQKEQLANQNTEKNNIKKQGIACQASVSVECEDPYLNNEEFRGNWAGEWNEFNKIKKTSWRNLDENWCLTVLGKPQNGETADCWSLECHQNITCQNEVLCGVDNEENPTKFVWNDDKNDSSCVKKDDDPSSICEMQCAKDTAILALVDGIDPKITPTDVEGRILANEADMLENPNNIYWYSKSVAISPSCEDIEPLAKTIYLLCDKTGKNCEPTPQYETESSCLTIAKEKKQICKQMKPYKSGCGVSGGVRTVHSHKGTVIVNAQDRAGNKGKATTAPIYIDHNLPDIETLKVEITTLDFVAGDAKMELFPVQNKKQEKIVAHDKYKIFLQITDSNCATKDCEERGYASGFSGIDWETSGIIIRDKTSDSILGGSSMMSFNFGQKSNENFSFIRTTKTEFIIDTPNFTETAELSFNGDIFKKAGEKTIDLIIRDKAGNILNTSKEEKTIQFEVGAGVAEKIELDTPVCEQALANNSDECKIKISVLDKFNNPITNRKIRFIQTIGQNIEGTYNLTEDAQQAFVNGIRAKDIITDSSIDTNGFVGTLLIRSLVPTIYTKNDKIGDDEIIYVDNSLEDEFTDKSVNPRIVDLVLEVEKVNGISVPINEYVQFAENTDVELKFLPWVYLKITTNKNCSDIRKKLTEIYLGDRAFEINLCAYTGVNQGILKKLLPKEFEVLVRGHSPAETDFVNHDIDQDIIGEAGATFVFENTKQKTFKTFLQSVITGKIGDLSNIGITSIVKIKIKDNDKFQTVIYPAGNLGVNDKFAGFLVGANIESGLLGEKFTYPESSNIFKIGTVSANDIKQDIKNNVYKIIKEISPENDNESLRNGVALSDQEVKFFKGDVIIGGTISGVGTIVIADGNLIIDNDLSYETTKSSLGVILINTQENMAKSKTGNIFINPSVKAIVGSYYADGSILSDSPNHPIDYAYNGNYQSQLKNQLVLEGSIFTQNSIGGSLGKIGAKDLLTPWETTQNLEEARKYDLHFIRNYNKSLIDMNTCGVGRTIKSVECNNLCTPSKNNKERCDRNSQAFVIRPDTRVLTTPPPGFSGVKELK